MSDDKTRGGGAMLTPVAIPRMPGAPSSSNAFGEPDAGSDWRLAVDVKQDAPGYWKSWYSHGEADLFVWTSPDGMLGSFQFCFDKDAKEQMVAWDRDKPLMVGSVDGGESTPLHNRSPVLGGVTGDIARAPDVWKRIKTGLPAELIRAVEHALGWS